MEVAVSERVMKLECAGSGGAMAGFPRHGAGQGRCVEVAERSGGWEASRGIVDTLDGAGAPVVEFVGGGYERKKSGEEKKMAGRREHSTWKELGRL